MIEIEEQLKVIEKLSERVHETFNALKIAEVHYTDRVEQHFDAKERLARAIDAAYDEGEVVGKNEREREANLRRMLPDEFNEVLRCQALIWGAEREYKSRQRDAERLTLQVAIAKITNDLQILQWNSV